MIKFVSSANITGLSRFRAAGKSFMLEFLPFYFNLFNCSGAPNGTVLISPAGLVVTQPQPHPQLVSLPPSHTWSGQHQPQGGAPTPPSFGQREAPPPPSFSQHDDRDRERYDDDEGRRHRRDRSRERRKKSRRDRSRSKSWSRDRDRRYRSRSRSRGRDDYRDRSRRSPRRDRDRSPRSRHRGESPGSDTEDWRTSSGNKQDDKVGKLAEWVESWQAQDLGPAAVGLNEIHSTIAEKLAQELQRRNAPVRTCTHESNSVLWRTPP